MKIRRIDHVGITVKDLPAAVAFFLDFGLELVGEWQVEGEWVGRVIGLREVKSDCAMLRTADSEVKIELSQFLSPRDESGVQRPAANTPGIRHITFVVEDIEALVAKLRENDPEPLGEIYNYQNTYKVCYVRGPEGIILELAEEL